MLFLVLFTQFCELPPDIPPKPSVEFCTTSTKFNLVFGGVKKTGEVAMDEEQRFAFDTWGFLTIEEAITEAQGSAMMATPW